ncbi:unnamed protein product [Scytosiphon promiscuus]
MVTEALEATEAWVWQDGSITDDHIRAATAGWDGSYFLAGFTSGNWNGANSGESDWATVKLDADGTEVWRYQGGTEGNDSFTAAAVDQQNGSVVLAGQMSGLVTSSASTTGNFAVLRIDAGGTVLWEFQDGTSEQDEVNGIAMAGDGSVVVVGATKGDWNGANASFDFAAFRLDEDGTEIWRYQDGTEAIDYLSAATMVDEDKAVVMGGYTTGGFQGLSAGNDDFVAIKLNSSDGTEIWRYQDGSSETDLMYAVAGTEDEGVVLAGFTDGTWSVDNAGASDFAAVKLDSDGIEVWRYQDGTNSTDMVRDVEVQADGSVLLAGTTGGDWTGLNDGGDGGGDWALISLSTDGEENWRWQGGSEGDDDLYGMATGSDGNILMAGATTGSWGRTNLGDDDFVGIVLNMSTVSSTVVTPAPSVIVSSTLDTPAPSFIVSGTPDTPAPSVIVSSTLDTPAPSVIVSRTPDTPAPSVIVRSAPDTPAPSAIMITASGAPVSTPSPSSGSASDTTPMIAGVVSAVGAVVLVALGAWTMRRRRSRRKNSFPPPVDDFELGPARERGPHTSFYGRDSTKSAGEGGGRPLDGNMIGSPLHEHTSVEAEESDGGGAVSNLTSAAAARTRAPAAGGSSAHAAAAVAETVHTSPSRNTPPHEDGGNTLENGAGKGPSMEESRTAINSSAEASAIERAELNRFLLGQNAARATAVAGHGTSGDVAESGGSPEAGRRARNEGFGLGDAVLNAAQELANHCQTPGISEAATAVSILVNLVSDSRDGDSDARIRQCRAIVMMLERAAKVTGKGGETAGYAERVMIEDVHDAVFDLVELIKTYQSKSKLSKVLMSTLFKRRQEELDAVVDRAIVRLQLSLQVQVGQDVSAVKEGIDVYKGSIARAKSEALAEARSARRQRKLEQIEIPEEEVAVSDELLGTGGFGQVYLADLNGRNAAAKVLCINHNLWKRADDEVLDGRKGNRSHLQQENNQRKAFLRELDAMIRLRSPHTVNVYGAVTSLQDRLILVMELLVGGDLRTLLKNSEHPLPEDRSRGIIGDVCAGMTFLHGKGTVHGDLKSANVLLDGAGRAKIGDFGTSRWSQHTASTGLATYTKTSGQSNQMSLAWSAPEVLEATGSTFASDVYSFGIVAWEVLSRELPWANVTHPRDIYIRVVLKGLRPDFPAEAPADMVDMVRACWLGDPKARPVFQSIMEDIKLQGWRE